MLARGVVTETRLHNADLTVPTRSPHPLRNVVGTGWSSKSQEWVYFEQVFTTVVFILFDFAGSQAEYVVHVVRGS